MTPGGSRGRVLIIDDYTDAVESLCLIVEGWGYDAQGAVTGEDGLAQFAAHVPDIVLVDFALPDIDGCEVIRRMRTVAPEVFIVVHSGYLDLSGAARTAGADAVILKPNLDALEEVLRQHAVGPRPGRVKRVC